MKAGELTTLLDAIDPSTQVVVQVTRDLFEDPHLPPPFSVSCDVRRIVTTLVPGVPTKNGQPTAFSRTVIELQP